ncbi:hypothetical protein IC611_21490 [Proteus mirabilis]
MSCPDLTAVGGCADKPSRPAEPVADRYRDSGQHRSCPAGTSDLYPSAGAGTVTAGGRTLSGAYGDVAPTIKEMP